MSWESVAPKDQKLTVSKLEDERPVEVVRPGRDVKFAVSREYDALPVSCGRRPERAWSERAPTARVTAWACRSWGWCWRALRPASASVSTRAAAGWDGAEGEACSPRGADVCATAAIPW